MTNPIFPTIPSAPVTQVFGNYNPALYGGDRKHKGIDYGIIANNPVYACMDGIVQMAVTGQTGYGRHVKILHPDGALSVYGHLNKLLVKTGDAVLAGQEIGKSGGDPKDAIDGDGVSTGAHLHWEIRPPGLIASDQTAVDPMNYCLQYLSVKTEIAECAAAQGLNVRSEPFVNARQIGALKRKEVVRIVERKNGWARIHSLRPEWISEKYLFFTGEIFEPVQAAVNIPSFSSEEKLNRLWEAHPELY